MFTNVTDFKNYTDKLLEVLRTNHEKILNSSSDTSRATESEASELNKRVVQSQETSTENKENNILNLFAYCDNNFLTMKQQIGFWKYVSPDKKIRDASVEYENILSFYYVDLFTNTNMYVQLIKYFASHEQKLNKLQDRYIKKVLSEFKKYGVENTEKIHEIKTIEKKIIELEQKIITNINNTHKIIKLSKIDGLPEKIKKSLKTENNNYIIPLEPYYYKICMKHIHNEEIRKNIYYKYNTLCYNENGELLIKLILANNRKALLHNKTSYTDYCYDKFMVSHKKINKLIQTMRPDIESLYLEEIRALLAKKDNKTSKNINMWDTDYYYNKIEEDILGTTKFEDIKNYFSLDNIFRISFNMCRYYFNVIIEKHIDKVWYDNVYIYNVFDEKSKKLIGTIYFDLFIRPYKYKDNMCYTIIPYYEQLMNGKKFIQSPYVAVIMNINDIKENDGKTILTSHAESLQFIKLLGNALHSIFGKNEYCRLSGNNIETDLKDSWPYVFQYLFWDKDILEQFEHWKTKEKIPKTIVNNIIKTKAIQNGYKYKYILTAIKYDIIISSCSVFFDKLKAILTKKSSQITTSAIDLLQDIYKVVFNKMFESNKTNLEQHAIKLYKTSFPLLFDYNFVTMKSKYFCDLWSQIHADDIFYTRYNNDIFLKDTYIEFKQLVLDIGWASNYRDQTKKFIGGRDVLLDSFYIDKFYVIRDVDPELVIHSKQSKQLMNKNKKTVKISFT